MKPPTSSVVDTVGQQCSWASAEKRGYVVTEDPPLKPHKSKQQQQLSVQLILLPLYLGTAVQQRGTSVPGQHLQSQHRARQLLPGKGEHRTGSAPGGAGPGAGGLGSALSMEERAELLGLGQTHMCRVNRKPMSQTRSPGRLGLAGQRRKGRGDKRLDKQAGLTLIPVPPLESRV